MDTFLKPLRIAEQSATPLVLPPSGYQFIYPKVDGKMYALNSSGIETECTNVSSVGGGGGVERGKIHMIALGAIS